MPATAWGWEVTRSELESWILQQSSDLIVLNKPPGIVCHPSRYGPWSSLIGSVREYTGVARVHMPSRLDRETSGVLVFALNSTTGRELQHAVLRGQTHKEYLAVLDGHLAGPVTVNQPVATDPDSAFYSRQAVCPEGRPAVTDFQPIASATRHTLVRVVPVTGRRHQIRVHAAWLGCPIAGDKLYGPDPDLMLRLIQRGFAPDQIACLPIARHALHAAEVSYGSRRFAAPLSSDIERFWNECQSGR